MYFDADAKRLASCMPCFLVQKVVLSLFVNVYMYSRSNPKSTAGRGELNWGLMQNQCRNYFLDLEKAACFKIVLLLKLFPPPLLPPPPYHCRYD